MKTIMKTLLYTLFLSLHISAIAQQFNVKDFGAKGDGKTDDYPAFAKMVAAVNKAKGGTVTIPKGTYYLDAYIGDAKGSTDLIYESVNNLTINGNGAKIVMNGKYHRTVNKVKRYKYSDKRGASPFVFRNANNVKISNLEIDGGVAHTTREEKVAEGPTRLISVTGSTNVQISDIYVHHSMCDGITITHNNDRLSQNVTVKNVKSYYNARQGLTIAGLINGQFINCDFSHTGITGKYGGHSPQDGLDIEPRRGFDVKDIVFDNCRFENNAGSQIAITSPMNTNGVIIKNSIIDAKDSRSKYQIIIAAKNVTFQNNTINAGNGAIYPLWNTHPGSIATFRNNKIKANSSGFVLVPNKQGKDHITIEGNTIEYTGTAPVSSYFPYIIAENTIFNNNAVIIPLQYQKQKGGTFMVSKVKESVGNTFGDVKGMKKAKPIYTKSLKVNDK